MTKASLDFATEMRKLQQRRAQLRVPPIVKWEGDLIVISIGRSVELRLDFAARNFSIRLLGFRGRRYSTRDLLDQVIWTRCCTCIWPVPTSRGGILEFMSVDGWKERDQLWDAVDQFQHEQLRAVSRALLAQIPYVLTNWILRSRVPWITFADICLLWKYFEEARSVAHDNIRLLSVWLWSSSDLLVRQDWNQYWTPGRAAPYAVVNLRARLRRLGFPDRIWKLFCRFGAQVLPERWSSHFSNPDQRYEATIRYLQLVALDGLRNPSSRTEKATIARFVCFEEREITGHPKLFRAALRQAHIETAQKGWNADIESMCNALRTLMQMRIIPDANQARAGWNWWLKQLPLAERDQFRFRISPFSIGLYRVIPLCSNEAVIEEGRRMNNCLAHSDCSDKYGHLYSIRRISDDESMATVEIAISCDDVEVFQAEGIGNSRRPKCCARAIAELLRRYHVALRQYTSHAPATMTTAL